MRIERTGRLVLMFTFLCTVSSTAQDKSLDPAARQQIDAGNQAWVDGMKRGDIRLLVDGYTSDAVDCNSEGVCLQGRTALEEHVKKEIAKFGTADSASVTTVGSVQQGHFIYEWGQAEAHFPNGRQIVDRYLTVWREEPKGRWKVFRNLVMPEK